MARKAGDYKSPYRGKATDRRGFLETTGKALGGIAVVSATGVYFHNRDPRGGTPSSAQVRNFTVPDDGTSPEVVLARGSDPAELADRVLAALGGVERFIARGDRVAIKPNIGWERFPEQAANTNPWLVARVVERCLEAGAAEVVVTDVSCNDAQRAFQKSGIGDAAHEAGARVVLPQPHHFEEMEIGGTVLHRWEIYQPLVQANKVINMAIVKHHSLTHMTAGMKNWYGILGGSRNLLHQSIHQSIFDLANFIRPTLTILDGIRVLVRNGPQGGSYDDVEDRNVVIAGTDQVACDALGATLLGLDGRDLPYLVLADGVIGHIDANRVRYREI